jgi:hypothetical protein
MLLQENPFVTNFMFRLPNNHFVALIEENLNDKNIPIDTPLLLDCAVNFLMNEFDYNRFDHSIINIGKKKFFKEIINPSEQDKHRWDIRTKVSHLSELIAKKEVALACFIEEQKNQEINVTQSPTEKRSLDTITERPRSESIVSNESFVTAPSSASWYDHKFSSSEKSVIYRSSRGSNKTIKKPKNINKDSNDCSSISSFLSSSFQTTMTSTTKDKKKVNSFLQEDLNEHEYLLKQAEHLYPN